MSRITGYLLLRANESGRAQRALQTLGGNVAVHGPLGVLEAGSIDGCRAIEPTAQLAVWFLGLLFNRESLAAELGTSTRPGIAATTDGDLVLAAYRAHGREAFGRLSGQFAIVLADLARGDFHFVRDQVGAKTLHYVKDGGILWFSTAFRPLLALSDRPRPNLRALFEFTLHGDVFPPDSLYEGVTTLPAGCWLALERGASEPVLAPYHDLREVVSEVTYRRLAAVGPAAFLEQLDEHFHRSVHQNLGGAGFCSVALSGGVDSAMVTAIAARHANVAAVNLSIPQGSEFDERPIAERIARHLNVPLSVVTIDGAMYRRELAAATDANEMPLWHLQNLGLYLVARRARELGASCLLTGDTFGMVLTGHNQEPWRNVRRMLALLRRAPEATTAFLCKLGHAVSGLPLDSHGFPWAQPLVTQLIDGYARSELQRHADDAYGFVEDAFERRVLAGRLAEVRHWYDRFYYRGDRLTSAQEIGFRSPFGDLDSLRFGMNIPYAYLKRAGANKWGIKELGARYVTREIAYRKKVAWRMPVNLYFRPWATSRFFENGFCSETFGLTPEAIAAQLPGWLASGQQFGRLVHIEVWGRLFARGESVDQVADWLASFEN